MDEQSSVWVTVKMTDREADALLAKAKSGFFCWSMLFRPAAEGYALGRAIRHLQSGITAFRMAQDARLREWDARLRG